MRNFNFLSKSSSQSCGHSSVTLASTVGSQEEFYVSGGNSRGAFTPADVCQTSSVRLNRFTAHRRSTMLRLLSVLVLVLTFGVGNVWGAEEIYKTALFGSNYNSQGISSYSNSWYSTYDGFRVDITNANNSNNGWNYIKMGSKSAASTGTITTNAAIDKAVTKVVLTIDAITTSSIKSITLKTSSNGSSWTNAGTFDKSTGAKTVTLSSPATSLYYKIEVDCKKDKNGLISISRVDYYQNSGGSTPTALTDISLSSTSAWLEKGGSITLTPSFTPENASNKNVTWTSSNTSIATVSDAGVVTASNSNTGNATITCTSQANNSIKATCSITVANGDKLTSSSININNSYSDWSDKTGSEGVAKYAGYSYGNNKIQLKAESNSGIVSTTSGGKIKNVSVVWDASNTQTRTLDIYGNNTAYSASSALYSNATATKGKKIGSITYPATTCTLDLSEGDYQYVGVRSNSGTAYFNSITFFWEPIPTYTLTYGMASSSSGHGSLGAQVNSQNINSGSTVQEGATVTLAPSFNAGYQFASWTTSGIAANDITNNVFTMPSSNVSIELVLEAIPLTALTINKSSISLEPKQSEQLSVASVTPNTALSTVSWESSDNDVATVTNAGLVEAQGDGTATITARSTVTTSVYATCTVTVTSPAGVSDPIMTLDDDVSHNAGSVVKVNNYSSAYIYAYTLDGTTTPALDEYLDPVDENTHVYDHTNGITLSSNCTLKIIAYDEDHNSSNVVTKNYTINPAATVYLYENTILKATLTENLFVGSSITCPTPVASSLGTKTFVGWSSSTTVPDDMVTFPYTLSSTETTLHAVYATPSDPTYTKLTSDDFDENAVYVIGAEQADNNSTLWFKSSTYTVDGDDSWGNAVGISASNKAFFTLSGTADALVAQDAAGKYLVVSNANKNFRMSSTSATVILQDNGTIQSVRSDADQYLRYNYNNGSGGFRWYNSETTQPAYFYKYEAASYTGHVTSVATYAITKAVCENGSMNADMTTATADATITISATPEDGYALLAFDVYKTGASATKVDFTVDENDYKVATFTMPAYAVTVSATFIKVGTASNPLTVAELQTNKADLVDYYVYAQGIVSELGSLNNGKYTYYFSADGSTTNQFQVYKGYKGSHQVGEEWYYDGFENASDLAVGDEVIVEGYIALYDNTTYQFSDSESELTYHCRPVVVSKGAETASEGTYTLTSGGNALSEKYCLADLPGENDLTVTVTASPQPGYRLKSIISLDGETVVGTVGAISNNSCTITGIKASTTITANFEQVFAVSLAINANGTLHGDCSATINEGAGPVSVAAGETINLAASVVSADDEFVNWTATEGITIANATALSTTATATQAGTITANFRPLADPHTITNGGVNAAYGTIVMKDMEDNVVTSLNLRPDKTGKLVATESEGYRFLSWTVSPANAVTFADATSLETTFTAKDVEASISATYEARTAYTVKFMNGNTQIGTDATVYDGRTIDLLGAQTSFDANHTRFCGWVKNSFEGLANVEPSFVSGAQTIDDNTTFYAVYGNANETNNYGKITEAAELESGKNYLIVAEYNSGLEALHAAELSKEYWLKTGVVTADNNVIASTVAERTWQISVNAGVAHVYNAENEKYLGVNYVSSGDHYNARIFDNAYDLTIMPNDGAWNISGVSNTKTVYVIHAPGYPEYIGSNVAAPVYLYKQLYESDEWVSLPVEYVNVTFDKHAGSETVTNMPANITNQMKGYSLTAPSETPERAGYNFIGWNTDDEATEPMSFPQTINTNTTVYAIWQAYPDCAIDLYVNGVKDDDISTSVKQGAELDLSAIDAPERLGYDFLGWAANPRPEENTTAIDIVEAYTPTPNEDTQKSFYAVYTRQEGQAQYEKASSISAGKYLIVCEDQNVAFDGSLNALDGAGRVVAVSISDDVIAYSETIDASTFNIAEIDDDVYSIQSASGIYIGRTDDANEIDENKSTVYTNTITITSGDADIVGSGGAHLRCNPNNGNQWFRYFKSSSYTNQKAIQLYKYIAGTTYYTTNPAVNYNVSYNLAGGAWKEDEGCESAIVAANDNYDVCEDVPVKTDYIFTGWTVGGEAIGTSITVTGTTVILANYREAETYSVTYNANGALGTAPATASVKEGANYTVLANSWFFKAGYSFTGWNTAADGNGTAYAKDAIMTMPSENVTLYAQWSNSLSERDVVIVAHYGDKYYAMGQTLSSGQLNAVQVQMLNGKVRDVAEENRAAITWHMIVNSSNNTVSFYSPAKEKYLGISSNNLAYADEAVEWTWDNTKKCYKIGAAGTRTFWYRNSDATSTYNCFKYYSTSNVGVSGYASEMILAYGFAVTIDGDATESAITVGDDVVVTEDAELTINNERVLNSLTVENGGSVSGSATLIVQDLTIKTSLGTVTGEETQSTGKSGEISNSNITANGDVWIEIELTQASQASFGWYAFSVPFPVNTMNGVYYQNTPLQNEVGYAIMAYHEDERAAGKYAWKKYRETNLVPGMLYIITVGDTDYKTLRFKKAQGTNLIASNSVPVSYTTASGEGASGWNGVGNPNLQVSHQNDYPYLQFLDHDDNCFRPRTAATTNLLVGTAFMVQVAESTENITIATGANSGEGNIALAPARAPKAIENTIFEVKLRNTDTGKTEDNLFFTAREDATNEYEIGRDVAKMSMGNAKCAQMWVPAYGTQLCAADFQLVNNQAEYPLTINTPKAGTYSISVQENENATIYLTRNGRAIWNLSMSACELDLTQGLNEGYGLRLVVNAPAVVTGVDQIDAKADVQKVIIDEHVYILRGGQMYDVNGKMVK